MEMPEFDERQEWEWGVASRLARLRSMPVDTSRVEKALRGQLPLPEPAPAAGARSLLRPMGAVAASLLLAGALATVLLLSASNGPVLASPAGMAELHNDVVSGKVPVVQVESIAEANRVLSNQWPDSPGVPSVPRDHVMACCMQSLKDKKLACVLMKVEGVPVTLTVAHGKDMRAPASPVTVRHGVRYHVQSEGKLNMVMTERQGRWVCLIGEVPADKLIDDVVRELNF